MRYITQESVEVTEVIETSFGYGGVAVDTRRWIARVSGSSWYQSRVDHRVRSARIEMEREGPSFEGALANLKDALAEQGVELR